MTADLIHNDNTLSCYQGARVLVTGGTGFIGSGLVAKLESLGASLTILRRKVDPEQLDETLESYRYIFRDLANRETWLELLSSSDYVFYLGGQTSVQVAAKDPIADLHANIIPLLHALEVAKEIGVDINIIFAGTATEVGLTEAFPVDEMFQDRPATIYDIHKLLAEKYLHFYADCAHIHTLTLRPANVYGPGPSPTQSDRGVLNAMIRRGLKGETLEVHGPGEFVRDFVYVDDVIDAFLHGGSKIRDLRGRYAIIGTGVATRFVDAINLIADRVLAHTGQRPPVLHVPAPTNSIPLDFRSFVAATTFFTTYTTWHPRYSLAEGIDSTIRRILEIERPMD